MKQFKVTVVFLASVFLTAVAILLLYFRSQLQLPGGAINSIDNAFISYARRARNLGSHTPGQSPRSSSVDYILWKLLQTLSDQQLVTGAALAIATYVRLADSANFSVYSLRMATSNIWLSCLTHMCTLVALRREPKEETRKWTLYAAGVLVVLLMPILFLVSFPSFILDPTLSVRCALRDLSAYEPAVSSIFVLQAFLSMGLIVGGYSRRMFHALYHPNPPSNPPQQHDDESPRRSKLSLIRDAIVCVFQNAGGRRNFDKFALFVLLNKSELHDPEGLERQIRRHLFRELSISYLWELVWLAFYYNLGITSTIVTWSRLPPLSQWSLSFGQLVPISLFLFNIIPMYGEYKGIETIPAFGLCASSLSLICFRPPITNAEARWRGGTSNSPRKHRTQPYTHRRKAQQSVCRSKVNRVRGCRGITAR